MTQVVSDDVLGKFARKQNDWFARVRAGSLDPEAVGKAIQAIIDRQAAYLTPLYPGETISLPATKGPETIAEASAVFAYIDPAFKIWGTNQPGQSAKACKLQVFEICRDDTFEQLFSSLGVNLDQLTLTQGQIIKFRLLHRDKLRQDGYGTFLLFKVGAERFVAVVGVDGVQLKVRCYRFSDGIVWYAGSRHRVVVPQLAV